MDKKFCDKHAKKGKLKEIKGKYYNISIWEQNTDSPKEKEILNVDYCPACFGETNFGK